jgi:hypothetical protein
MVVWFLGAEAEKVKKFPIYIVLYVVDLETYYPASE